MEVYFVFLAIVLVYAMIELLGFKINVFLKFVYVAMLIAISGFRYEVGNDYNNYVLIFDHPENFSYMEPGLKMLNKVVDLMGYNVQLVFLISSIITIIPIAFAIYKIIPRYFCTALSVYALSYIYFEGMNTVRQAISMSIILCAVCYYISKPKLTIYVLLTALAIAFHYSAVIIGGIAWLMLRFSGKEIKYATFFVAIIISFIMGFFIQSYASQIGSLASVFGYSGYMSVFEQRGVNSGTFHYVLNLYAIGFLIYSKYHEKVLSYFDKCVFKMFFVAVIIYNLFINFYIGLRFYWYFYLFVIFVVPALLSHYKKDTRVILFIAIMLVFSVYTYLSLGTDYYSPYKYTFEFVRRI